MQNIIKNKKKTKTHQQHNQPNITHIHKYVVINDYWHKPTKNTYTYQACYSNKYYIITLMCGTNYKFYKKIRWCRTVFFLYYYCFQKHSSSAPLSLHNHKQQLVFIKYQKAQWKYLNKQLTGHWHISSEYSNTNCRNIWRDMHNNLH